MTWDVRDKTILVTGATGGIGLESAVQLASRGARLLLVGRDPGRLQAAVAAVRERGRGRDVVGLRCDFSSQAQVRALAEAVRGHTDRLHVLINNAGGVHKQRTETADGIEATFATNHLGYFLLTNLLLGLLHAAAPARVISVSSVGHRSATLDLDDPGFAKAGYSIMRAYGRSKLANILFANELARRLAGTGVTSNSLHPGAVATNIWSGAPLLAKPFILLAWPFFLKPAQGAERITQLAVDPALGMVTGRYFERGVAVAPSALAQDGELGRRLWERSAQLVGLPA